MSCVWAMSIYTSSMSWRTNNTFLKKCREDKKESSLHSQIVPTQIQLDIWLQSIWAAIYSLHILQMCRNFSNSLELSQNFELEIDNIRKIGCAIFNYAWFYDDLSKQKVAHV